MINSASNTHNYTPLLERTRAGGETPSLEDRFREESMRDVVIEKVETDYCAPNERLVHDIAKHVKDLPAGILVSVGAERVFFLLLAAVQENGDRIEGLVVRDTNPTNKAYLDFAILLLRVSDNLEDFKLLSSRKNQAESLAALPDKIRISGMPEAWKNYYLSHLLQFSHIYFSVSKSWQEKPLFDILSYYKHPHLFDILQKYAKEGKIVTTVGNLSDDFIREEPRISLVDLSNAPDHFVWKAHYPTRTLWTRMTFRANGDFEYSSGKVTPLSPQEDVELDRLVGLLRDRHLFPKYETKENEQYLIQHSIHSLLKICPPDYEGPSPILPCRSREILYQLHECEKILLSLDAPSTEEK